MCERSTVALSVVVLARGSMTGYLAMMHHLAAQRVALRLEVVVVASDDATAAECQAYSSSFGVLQVAVHPALSGRGEGAAKGVRLATSPLVALTEDHAYPFPDWAEQVIDAHEVGFAAIAPAIVNANAGSAWGRVNHDLAYGRWPATLPTAEVSDIPGFNSTFDRVALLEACGDRLDWYLERIGEAHAEIRRRGGRFRFVPAARLAHWNPSRPRPSLQVWYLGARLVGTGRARAGNWTVARRLLYVGGAPLIPLMRLRAFLRDTRARRTDRRESPAYWAVLSLLMVGITVGEVVGYMTGEGDILHRSSDFEFGRDRYVRPEEARALRAMHNAGRRATESDMLA